MQALWMSSNKTTSHERYTWNQ
uniref:Uncharacterized protein n=1 Tax=Anopheles albimanus TaxID=7167 RepID=A0A182FXI4_ANOAL